MDSIGIFYAGSATGQTAQIAAKLQKAFTNQDVSIYNIETAKKEDLQKHSLLILGTAAWGIGEMHAEWNNFIDSLLDIDFKNTKIALFGLGDQNEYPESFVDGLGTLFCRLAHKENVIGYTSANGYNFYYSTAEINGQFVGLALDNDSQPQLTDKRIEKWVAQLAKELHPASKKLKTA